MGNKKDDIISNENKENSGEESIKESEEVINESLETETVKIQLLETQLKEEKNKFLRLFAEFENYKKRTQKERVDLFRTANQEVLRSMLPVCDDFERAIENIRKTTEIDKNFIEGIELIQHKLYSTLESKGLSKIKIKESDDFNTDFHEAVTQIPAPDKSLKGKIIDVIEPGYTLNDKVIRFAKVVVGK